MLGAAFPGAWSLCFCKTSHLSRLFVLILVPAFCVVPDHVLGQSLTVQEIAGRRSTAVVTITTDDSFGSGVIIDPAGVIVSNFHVVQGALSATVRLSNGDAYDEVLVIGVDERRDLVLLKIQGFGLPAAPLGDSEELRPGDSIVLIGTPEGLAQTVSSGIVSGIRDTGELMENPARLPTRMVASSAESETQARAIGSSRPMQWHHPAVAAVECLTSQAYLSASWPRSSPKGKT